MERKSFNYEEERSNGDILEAVMDDEGVTITIENPCAGSTGRGIGAFTSIRMPRDQQRAFGMWLVVSAMED